MRFKVVLEAGSEGGYTVLVPSLPGCISEGAMREEALKNIKEAIVLYLEAVKDDWEDGWEGEALLKKSEGDNPYR